MHVLYLIAIVMLIEMKYKCLENFALYGITTPKNKNRDSGGNRKWLELWAEDVYHGPMAT